MQRTKSSFTPFIRNIQRCLRISGVTRIRLTPCYIGALVQHQMILPDEAAEARKKILAGEEHTFPDVFVPTENGVSLQRIDILASNAKVETGSRIRFPKIAAMDDNRLL